MNQEEVDLIYAYLHEKYYYNDEGHLINKKTNDIVYGYLDMSSKRLLFRHRFSFNKKKYNWSLGHIIYLMHHKIKPKYIIYVNGNNSDNRIQNIKVASLSEVMLDSDLSVKNKHGLKGVIKDNKRYGARLWTGKTYKYVGWFYTPEQAHEAYLLAKKEYYN